MRSSLVLCGLLFSLSLQASSPPSPDALIQVHSYPDCELSEVIVDNDYFLKSIPCAGLCPTLKQENEVYCSTEGSHPGAPPKAWGHIAFGKSQVCFDTRRASGDFMQQCYEATPRPSIVRD